jgi:hypothetical protein
MTKILGTALLFVGMSVAAFATAVVPEVDGASSVSAIALVSGTLLVLRRRRK